MGCYLILTQQDLADALAAALGPGTAAALINELRNEGLYRDILRASEGTRSDRIAILAASYQAQLSYVAAAELAAAERAEARAEARDLAEQYALESAQVTEELAAATAQAWRDYAVQVMQTREAEAVAQGDPRASTAAFSSRQGIGTAFSGPKYGAGGKHEPRPWNLVDDVVVAGRVDQIARDDKGDLRVEAEHPVVTSDGRRLEIDRLTHLKDGTIEVREVFSGEGQASYKIAQVAEYGKLIERDFPGHKVDLVLHSTSSFDAKLVRDAAAAGVRIVH